MIVLFWSFVAVKRHDGHATSLKKTVIEGACIQFQQSSQLSSWQGACGRQAEAVLHLAGNRKSLDTQGGILRI